MLRCLSVTRVRVLPIPLCHSRALLTFSFWHPQRSSRFAHAAHLGGSLFGIWYAEHGKDVLWRQRHAIAAWYEAWMDAWLSHF